MLTPDDYFGRMSHVENPSLEVMANAEILLERVNNLLDEVCTLEHCEPALMRQVRSGWRTAQYNAGVPNAAPNSKHITGQAIDIADNAGTLADLLNNQRGLLEKHQLWMESPLATKTWCHLQCVPPRSGNRVFIA